MCLLCDVTPTDKQFPAFACLVNGSCHLPSGWERQTWPLPFPSSVQKMNIISNHSWLLSRAATAISPQRLTAKTHTHARTKHTHQTDFTFQTGLTLLMENIWLAVCGQQRELEINIWLLVLFFFCYCVSVSLILLRCHHPSLCCPIQLHASSSSSPVSWEE